jgi:hypothetical protein
MVAIIGAVFLVKGRAFSFMLASALFTDVVFAITTAFNVPINNQVSAWTAGRAPQPGVRFAIGGNDLLNRMWITPYCVQPAPLILQLDTQRQ